MDVRRGHIADVASSPIRCVELVELVTDWMEGGLSASRSGRRSRSTC